MKLVKFKIGDKYFWAVKKGFWPFIRYADLADPNFSWPKSSTFFNACLREDTPENREFLERIFPQLFIQEQE